MGKVKVWDGFIRGFHWLLVIALGVLYISGEEGWLELHFVTGYVLLALMLARLVWGVIGSETARLSKLINHPKKVVNALIGKEDRVGHNAAGSLMVVLFFVLILLQLVTGLFTTDDILVDGPLVQYVSYNLVELAGSIHHSNVDFIIAAIALHILAIIAYRFKGKNLIKTLLTGKVESSLQQPKMKAGWIAYIIFALFAAVLIFLWGMEPLSQLMA
ncbi:cytochrome b/b6 domain-containing protein [Pseudoalteromonas sp. MTN2-4]|uniref:cytochrome b/b6 domain-containing protein n=1 Tax=Pseudoalteromonas sp. MTN2-4 TaxID=3056555 RepID=UPI0036F2618F